MQLTDVEASPHRRRGEVGPGVALAWASGSDPGRNTALGAECPADIFRQPLNPADQPLEIRLGVLLIYGAPEPRLDLSRNSETALAELLDHGPGQALECSLWNKHSAPQTH